MKKNEDELTELFRSRLNRYEIPLQKDMWEDLEKEISKPSPRKLYSACFIAVAAIFLILLACSAAVWMFAPQKSISSSVSKASKSLLEKHMVRHAIINPDTTIIIQETSGEDEIPVAMQEEKVIAQTQNEESKPDSVINKSEDNLSSQNIVLASNADNKTLSEEVQNIKEVEIPNEWTVGLNFSIEKGKTISSIGNNLEPITINHKSPISVGVSISKRISDRLALESGLNYTLLRSESKDLNGATVDEQKTHFLGIPIRLNWTFLKQKKVNLYTSVGGMLEECIAPKTGSGSGEEEKNCVNGLQCSLASSLGIQYNATTHVALFAEPGLAYYFDDHTLASTIRREKPLNFNLRCGVKLMY